MDANNERVDTLCLGLLYCNSFDLDRGDGFCGGTGAFCQASRFPKEAFLDRNLTRLHLQDKTVGTIPAEDAAQDLENFLAFNQFW